MFKKLWNFNVFYIILLIFLALQTFGFYCTSGTELPFVLSLVALICLTVMAVIRMITTNNALNKLIKSINDDINYTATNALTSFNLPLLIVSKESEIVWYNGSFSDITKENVDTIIGKNITEIIGETGVAELSDKQKTTINYCDRIFDVYETLHQVGDSVQHILVFIDVTKLRKMASEYKLSRPVVAFIAIDNLEDLTANMRDSERNTVSSKIQHVLENWFSTVNGLSRKLSGERYLFVFEERDLISFTANKFDILNRIKAIDFGGRGKATVSIGIGYGNNMRECEEQAAQALDMALGRGGDQVAIKKRDNSFQFFGGISAGNEKRTRVRTRIVASALSELITSSDRVIIMGHKFADLDCFGSAYALCSAIRKRNGKDCVVAINKKTALVKPLFDRIESLGGELHIAEPEDILPLVTEKTLLIIVDTHRPSTIENSGILNKAGTVVVVDHHRKSVDYIGDAVIFYHESSASSTCEMVSELIQYLGENYMGKPEAEALLSGIMLDTKSYCINTGVRTFEASAFLRRRGADTIAVKKLFADSMEEYKIKNTVIATAEQIGCYAIAVNNNMDISDEERRIISSQAADELLSISNVKASFVISLLGGMINISARSFGEVNVQLIMEKLGGGGHRTMAACQLAELDINIVKQMLSKAIDEYEKG